MDFGTATLNNIAKRDIHLQLMQNLVCKIRDNHITALMPEVVVWEKHLFELWQMFLKYQEFVIDFAPGTYINEHVNKYDEGYDCYYEAAALIEVKRDRLKLDQKGPDSDTLMTVKLKLQFMYLVKRLEAMCDRIDKAVGKMSKFQIAYERRNLEQSFDKLKSIAVHKVELGDNHDALFTEELKIDRIVNHTLMLLFNANPERDP